MSARLFAREGPWLFSRNLDLLAFGGSAAAAWVLVALGTQLGLLEQDAPDLCWLLCVVAVDVAHVWSTGFRVYFDRGELSARPLLYGGLPLLAYGLGVLLYAFGPLTFWRALAYVALFHFMRQQVGFMALYERRSQPSTRAGRLLDRTLDRGTLYAVMLYPVLYWHAHLPRAFAWFVPGDFLESASLAGALRASVPYAERACFTLLGLFALRQLLLYRAGRLVPGKSVLLLATLVCWFGGIVWFDSDYVFTVTNVLLHGVPYLVLTHRYACAAARPSLARRIGLLGLGPFVLVCIALALAEETLWDRFVWHERPFYFGASTNLSDHALVLLVPLLAVPQFTHYLLDGFVWRVRPENPVLRRELEAA